MLSRGDFRATMARMKRFIPLLCLPLLLCLLQAPAAPAQAHADELRYAVAAGSDVWFYTAENDDAKLFLIPETYYVRVLYAGELYTAAEYLVNDPPYQKIMGYCRTDALTPVNFIPARPFLRKQITVSYTIPDSEASQDAFGSIDRTFVYYGLYFREGQQMAYVLSDGIFGYIPLREEPAFERNDDFLSVPSGPAEGEPGSAKTGGLNAVQIVAICVACAAAVAVAALVLRGKKRSLPPPDSERSDF